MELHHLLQVLFPAKGGHNQVTQTSTNSPSNAKNVLELVHAPSHES